MEQVDIRTIDPGDWDMAISLIWRVFLRCNASDYEQEGIESFLNFISDEHLKQFCALGEFECYGAWKQACRGLSYEADRAYLFTFC